MTEAERAVAGLLDSLKYGRIGITNFLFTYVVNQTNCLSFVIYKNYPPRP